MSSNKVGNIIQKNSKEKIIKFILKSAERFKSIKDFNSRGSVERLEMSVTPTNQKGKMVSKEKDAGLNSKQITLSSF